MKDLRAAKRILGMEISRNRLKGELYICQNDYTKKILKKFHMTDVIPVSTPLAQHFKL